MSNFEKNFQKAMRAASLRVKRAQAKFEKTLSREAREAGDEILYAVAAREELEKKRSATGDPKTREACDARLRKISNQRSAAARKATTPAGNAKWDRLNREYNRLQSLYWTLLCSSKRNPKLA